MKIVVALFVLVVGGSTALAQSSGGSTGSSGTTGSSTTGRSTTSPGGSLAPGAPAVTPGPVAPSPADGATVGRAPGVNPSNPQDLSGRSNPQDLSQPGGSNSQDMLPRQGTPQIAVPERK
jgi:hypothetical protein